MAVFDARRTPEILLDPAVVASLVFERPVTALRSRSDSENNASLGGIVLAVCTSASHNCVLFCEPHPPLDPLV